MGLVGDAAAAIASGRTDDPRRSSSLKEIRFAATFFDAYIDAQLDERVRDEFALLAACSYYLADLPGNARLLVSRIAEPSSQGADGLDWLTFKLLRSSFDLADTDRAQRPRLATALLSLQLYQTARGDPEPLLEATQTLRSEALRWGRWTRPSLRRLGCSYCQKENCKLCSDRLTYGFRSCARGVGPGPSESIIYHRALASSNADLRRWFAPRALGGRSDAHKRW
jgi:hypothetical protein